MPVPGETISSACWSVHLSLAQKRETIPPRSISFQESRFVSFQSVFSAAGYLKLSLQYWQYYTERIVTYITSMKKKDERLQPMTVSLSGKSPFSFSFNKERIGEARGGSHSPSGASFVRGLARITLRTGGIFARLRILFLPEWVVRYAWAGSCRSAVASRGQCWCRRTRTFPSPSFPSLSFFLFPFSFSFLLFYK